ncbi:MAG: MMPL family transporter, partial [Thermoplasmata archaeon]|nr:MMPL family transporter [Thermoplasmata archaeon]
MFIPLRNIDTETSMDDYIPESEAVDADETIGKEFSGECAVIIVVEARETENGSKNIVSPHSLMEMLTIEEGLRNNEKVSPYLVEKNGVFSVADAVQMALMAQFDKTIQTASEPEFAAAVNASLMNPEVFSLVSEVTNNGNGPHARAALIVVKVDNEYIENDWDKWEGIVSDIKDIIKKEDHKTVKLSVAGGMNDEMQKASRESLSRLLPISMIIIIIILYLSFRRASDVLLSVIAVPIIFIWTFGISELMGLGFTQFTFAAPILVLALGIDYGIHALHRYREELRGHASPDDAVKLSVTHVGAALFLTTVTTAGAFLSNVVSEVPAIRDFGITVAVGIVAAFIMMGIFLPALRLVVDNLLLRHGKTINEKTIKKQVQASTSRRPIFVLIADAALKRPVIVFVVVVLITLTSIYGALRLETEMEMKDLVKDDSEVVYAFDALNRYFPGVGNENGYILIKEGLTNTSTIQAMKEVLNNLYDDKHIVHVHGMAKSESIIPYLSVLMENETLCTEIGVHDNDGNGIPDSDEELKRAYDHLYAHGITMNGSAVSRKKIRSVLHRDADGEYDMALIIVE